MRRLQHVDARKLRVLAGARQPSEWSVRPEVDSLGLCNLDNDEASSNVLASFTVFSAFRI